MWRRVPPDWYAPEAILPEEAGGPAGESAGPLDLTLRYLGTAGFVVRIAGRTLVLDPFVTRPGAFTTLFRRLRTDEALLAKTIPHANDVLVGHAHHDHVLDAPALCMRTGARLIGSPSVANVARGAGVPEPLIHETSGGEEIACGPVVVKGLPARHGRVYLGRVPLKGRIESPPSWPARLRRFRHGQVLNWWLDTPKGRILHVDSADYDTALMAEHPCDVLCLCAIGWVHRPGYVEEIIEHTGARVVIPCHWDVFWRPLDQEPRLLPGVRLERFLEAVAAAGAKTVLLPPLATYRVPKMGTLRVAPPAGPGTGPA